MLNDGLNKVPERGPLQDDEDFIADYLGQSSAILQAYAVDPAQIALLHAITAVIVGAMRRGRKLLIAGNGGSAGDAQHIAAEFTGRMLFTRGGLPALALTTDSSALTAIGNDFGFEQVFARQVEALGQADDVLLVLTTSGRSENILSALDQGRANRMTTVGFTGMNGGAMVGRCDLLLQAPSDFTPVVQQLHLVAAHIICSLVERTMFPKR